MIESPLMIEFEAAARQKDILRFLTARFGTIPGDISEQITLVMNRSRLDSLVDAAAEVASLDEFAKKLTVRKPRKKKT